VGQRATADSTCRARPQLRHLQRETLGKIRAPTCRADAETKVGPKRPNPAAGFVVHAAQAESPRHCAPWCWPAATRVPRTRVRIPLGACPQEHEPADLGGWHAEAATVSAVVAQTTARRCLGRPLRKTIEHLTVDSRTACAVNIDCDGAASYSRSAPMTLARAPDASAAEEGEAA